jgi:hypothetical protein
MLVIFHLQLGIPSKHNSTNYVDSGFDGDHDAKVACRAPGTRKSPENTTANEQLALAA